MHVTRPPCGGLPGDKLSHREGEDKFQPLDVSGAMAVTGVIKGEFGLQVSPYCDGLPGDILSHREGEDKFQPLDVSGVAWWQKVILKENVASM